MFFHYITTWHEFKSVHSWSILIWNFNRIKKCPFQERSIPPETCFNFTKIAYNRFFVWTEQHRLHAVLELYYFRNCKITDFLLQKKIKFGKVPLGDWLVLQCRCIVSTWRTVLIAPVLYLSGYRTLKFLLSPSFLSPTKALMWNFSLFCVTVQSMIASLSQFAVS